MRADRLLSILLLLQVHRRTTARELATRLEVSERTIHRDMAALGMSGVPVRGERGNGGGWTLLESYQTNLTGLGETEIQALFLSKPARLLADLGLSSAGEAALIKLIAAMPAYFRKTAEEMRQRVFVDIAGWRQEAEPHPCLGTLQEAVWNGCKVRFTYPRGDGLIERVADPLGLVAKGSAWYLVAMVDGETRTYRVSRIQSVSKLEEICVRPSDFDLASYWEKSSSEFRAGLPRYAARLRFSAEEAGHVGSVSIYAQIEQEDPPDQEGFVTRLMRFETERAACAFVLGFAGKVQVLEPLELRERVLQMARDILSGRLTVSGGK